MTTISDETIQVFNWTFASGSELMVKGVFLDSAARFTINFGQSAEIIAAHIDLRFNAVQERNVIVLNSFENGAWQKEERGSSFPFVAGKEFKICVHFNSDTFDIYPSNGDKITFPNRLVDRAYKHMSILGDAKVEVIGVRTSTRPSKR